MRDLCIPDCTSFLNILKHGWVKFITFHFNLKDVGEHVAEDFLKEVVI